MIRSGRPLTRREQEVAGLVAQGLTNRQIAERLFIAERTAEYHVEQIRNKLGFHSRNQVAAWAVAEHGEAPPNGGAAASVRSDAKPRQLSRPKLRFLAVSLVAAVIAIAGGFALIFALNRPTTSAMPPSRIVQIDALAGRLTGAVSGTPNRGSDLAFGEGALWAVSYEARTLTRINPKTMAIVGSYGLSAPPVGIAVGDGSVWVATAFGDKALRPFDPKTDGFGPPVALTSGLEGITFAANSIWVTDKNSNAVYRVDPSAGTVSARIAVGEGPEAIAGDSKTIWVANAVDSTVSAMDATSSQVVATISLRGAATAIAAGPDAVWVASESVNLVTRIDPRTDAHLEIPLAASPSGLAVTGPAVWVALGASGQVARIDTSTNTMLPAIPVNGTVDAIGAGQGSIWVSVHDG